MRDGLIGGYEKRMSGARKPLLWVEDLEEVMKFGIRKPSPRKSVAARTSVKRMVRHSLGLKAPCGFGWLTNPKKAAYNRLYNRTSVNLWSVIRRLFR